MLERPNLAVQYLNLVFTINAAWARNEIGDGRYALIGADPAFHRWVSAEQKKAAHDEYERVRASSTASTGERVNTANKLLEVGAAAEALRVVEGAPKPLPAEALSAKVRALAALDRYQEAQQFCETAMNSTTNPQFALVCAAVSTATHRIAPRPMQ